MVPYLLYMQQIFGKWCKIAKLVYFLIKLCIFELGAHAHALYGETKLGVYLQKLLGVFEPEIINLQRLQLKALILFHLCGLSAAASPGNQRDDSILVFMVSLLMVIVSAILVVKTYLSRDRTRTAKNVQSQLVHHPIVAAGAMKEIASVQKTSSGSSKGNVIKQSLMVHDVPAFCAARLQQSFWKKRVRIGDVLLKLHVYPNGQAAKYNGFVQLVVEMLALPSGADSVVVRTELRCFETETYHCSVERLAIKGDCVDWAWALPVRNCRGLSCLQFGFKVVLLQSLHTDGAVTDYPRLHAQDVQCGVDYSARLEWEWHQLWGAVRHAFCGRAQKKFFTNTAGSPKMFRFCVTTDPTPAVRISVHLLRLPRGIASVTVLFRVAIGYPEYTNTFELDYDRAVATITLVREDVDWLLAVHQAKRSDVNLRLAVRIREMTQRDNGTLIMPSPCHLQPSERFIADLAWCRLVEVLNLLPQILRPGEIVVYLDAMGGGDGFVSACILCDPLLHIRFGLRLLRLPPDVSSVTVLFRVRLDWISCGDYCDIFTLNMSNRVGVLADVSKALHCIQWNWINDVEPDPARLRFEVEIVHLQSTNENQMSSSPPTVPLTMHRGAVHKGLADGGFIRVVIECQSERVEMQLSSRSTMGCILQGLRKTRFMGFCVRLFKMKKTDRIGPDASMVFFSLQGGLPGGMYNATNQASKTSNLEMNCSRKHALDQGEEMCSICQETIDVPSGCVTWSCRFCAHSLHFSCVAKLQARFGYGATFKCPVCRFVCQSVSQGPPCFCRRGISDDGRSCLNMCQHNCGEICHIGRCFTLKSDSHNASQDIAKALNPTPAEVAKERRAYRSFRRQRQRQRQNHRQRTASESHGDEILLATLRSVIGDITTALTDAQIIEMHNQCDSLEHFVAKFIEMHTQPPPSVERYHDEEEEKMACLDSDEDVLFTMRTAGGPEPENHRRPASASVGSVNDQAISTKPIGAQSDSTQVVQSSVFTSQDVDKSSASSTKQIITDAVLDDPHEQRVSNTPAIHQTREESVVSNNTHAQIFVDSPVRAERWDDTKSGWKDRGTGRVTITVDPDQDTAQLLFVDASNGSTRMKQWIQQDSCCECRLDAQDGVTHTQVEWTATDISTPDRINGKWRLLFGNRIAKANEFCAVYHRYSLPKSTLSQENVADSAPQTTPIASTVQAERCAPDSVSIDHCTAKTRHRTSENGDVLHIVWGLVRDHCVGTPLQFKAGAITERLMLLPLQTLRGLVATHSPPHLLHLRIAQIGADLPSIGTDDPLSMVSDELDDQRNLRGPGSIFMFCGDTYPAWFLERCQRACALDPTRAPVLLFLRTDTVSWKDAPFARLMSVEYWLAQLFQLLQFASQGCIIMITRTLVHEGLRRALSQQSFQHMLSVLDKCHMTRAHALPYVKLPPRSALADLISLQVRPSSERPLDIRIKVDESVEIFLFPRNGQPTVANLKTRIEKRYRGRRVRNAKFKPWCMVIGVVGGSELRNGEPLERFDFVLSNPSLNLLEIRAWLLGGSDPQAMKETLFIQITWAKLVLLHLVEWTQQSLDRELDDVMNPPLWREWVTTLLHDILVFLTALAQSTTNGELVNCDLNFINERWSDEFQHEFTLLTSARQPLRQTSVVYHFLAQLICDKYLKDAEQRQGCLQKIQHQTQLLSKSISPTNASLPRALHLSLGSQGSLKLDSMYEMVQTKMQTIQKSYAGKEQHFQKKNRMLLELEKAAGLMKDFWGIGVQVNNRVKAPGRLLMRVSEYICNVGWKDLQIQKWIETSTAAYTAYSSLCMQIEESRQSHVAKKRSGFKGKYNHNRRKRRRKNPNHPKRARPAQEISDNPSPADHGPLAPNLTISALPNGSRIVRAEPDNQLPAQSISDNHSPTRVVTPRNNVWSVTQKRTSADNTNTMMQCYSTHLGSERSTSSSLHANFLHMEVQRVLGKTRCYEWFDGPRLTQLEQMFEENNHDVVAFRRALVLRFHTRKVTGVQELEQRLNALTHESERKDDSINDDDAAVVDTPEQTSDSVSGAMSLIALSGKSERKDDSFDDDDDDDDDAAVVETPEQTSDSVSCAMSLIALSDESDPKDDSIDDDAAAAKFAHKCKCEVRDWTGGRLYWKRQKKLVDTRPSQTCENVSRAISLIHEEYAASKIRVIFRGAEFLLHDDAWSKSKEAIEAAREFSSKIVWPIRIERRSRQLHKWCCSLLDIKQCKIQMFAAQSCSESVRSSLKKDARRVLKALYRLNYRSKEWRCSIFALSSNWIKERVTKESWLRVLCSCADWCAKDHSKSWTPDLVNRALTHWSQSRAITVNSCVITQPDFEEPTHTGAQSAATAASDASASETMCLQNSDHYNETVVSEDEQTGITNAVAEEPTSDETHQVRQIAPPQTGKGPFLSKRVMLRKGTGGKAPRKQLTNTKTDSTQLQSATDVTSQQKELKRCMAILDTFCAPRPTSPIFCMGVLDVRLVCRNARKQRIMLGHWESDVQLIAAENGYFLLSEQHSFALHVRHIHVQESRLCVQSDSAILSLHLSAPGQVFGINGLEVPPISEGVQLLHQMEDVLKGDPYDIVCRALFSNTIDMSVSAQRIADLRKCTEDVGVVTALEPYTDLDFAAMARELDETVTWLMMVQRRPLLLPILSRLLVFEQPAWLMSDLGKILFEIEDATNMFDISEVAQLILTVDTFTAEDIKTLTIQESFNPEPAEMLPFEVRISASSFGVQQLQHSLQHEPNWNIVQKASQNLNFVVSCDDGAFRDGLSDSFKIHLLSEHFPCVLHRKAVVNIGTDTHSVCASMITDALRIDTIIDMFASYRWTDAGDVDMVDAQNRCEMIGPRQDTSPQTTCPEPMNAPDKETAGTSWTCEECTYINHVEAATHCSACETQRRGVLLPMSQTLLTMLNAVGRCSLAELCVQAEGGVTETTYNHYVKPLLTGGFIEQVGEKYQVTAEGSLRTKEVAPQVASQCDMALRLLQQRTAFKSENDGVRDLIPVQPDGNCLYRSLSVLLCGSNHWHNALRTCAMQFIRLNPRIFRERWAVLRREEREAASEVEWQSWMNANATTTTYDNFGELAILALEFALNVMIVVETMGGVRFYPMEPVHTHYKSVRKLLQSHPCGECTLICFTGCSHFDGVTLHNKTHVMKRCNIRARLQNCYQDRNGQEFEYSGALAEIGAEHMNQTQWRSTLSSVDDFSDMIWQGLREHHQSAETVDAVTILNFDALHFQPRPPVSTNHKGKLNLKRRDTRETLATAIRSVLGTMSLTFKINAHHIKVLQDMLVVNAVSPYQTHEDIRKMLYGVTRRLLRFLSTHEAPTYIEHALLCTPCSAEPSVEEALRKTGFCVFDKFIDNDSRQTILAKAQSIVVDDPNVINVIVDRSAKDDSQGDDKYDMIADLTNRWMHEAFGPLIRGYVKPIRERLHQILGNDYKSSKVWLLSTRDWAASQDNVHSDGSLVGSVSAIIPLNGLALPDGDGRAKRQWYFLDAAEGSHITAMDEGNFVDFKPVAVPVGGCILFSSTLHHCGKANMSDTPRFFLFFYFDKKSESRNCMSDKSVLIRRPNGSYICDGADIERWLPPTNAARESRRKDWQKMRSLIKVRGDTYASYFQRLPLPEQMRIMSTLSAKKEPADNRRRDRNWLDFKLALRALSRVVSLTLHDLCWLDDVDAGLYCECVRRMDTIQRREHEGFLTEVLMNLPLGHKLRHEVSDVIDERIRHWLSQNGGAVWQTAQGTLHSALRLARDSNLYFETGVLESTNQNSSASIYRKAQTQYPVNIHVLAYDSGSDGFEVTIAECGDFQQCVILLLRDDHYDTVQIEDPSAWKALYLTYTTHRYVHCTDDKVKHRDVARVHWKVIDGLLDRCTERIGRRLQQLHTGCGYDVNACPKKYLVKLTDDAREWICVDCSALNCNNAGKTCNKCQRETQVGKWMMRCSVRVNSLGFATIWLPEFTTTQLLWRPLGASRQANPQYTREHTWRAMTRGIRRIGMMMRCIFGWDAQCDQESVHRIAMHIVQCDPELLREDSDPLHLPEQLPTVDRDTFADGSALCCTVCSYVNRGVKKPFCASCGCAVSNDTAILLRDVGVSFEVLSDSIVHWSRPNLGEDAVRLVGTAAYWLGNYPENGDGDEDGDEDANEDGKEEEGEEEEEEEEEGEDKDEDELEDAYEDGDVDIEMQSEAGDADGDYNIVDDEVVHVRTVPPKQHKKVRSLARSRRRFGRDRSSRRESRMALRLIAMYRCHYLPDVQDLNALRTHPMSFDFAVASSVADEIVMRCRKSDHERNAILDFYRIDVNDLRDCKDVGWNESDSEIPAFDVDKYGLWRLEAVLGSDWVLFRANKQDDDWVLFTVHGAGDILGWRELTALSMQSRPVDLFYERYESEVWPQRCAPDMFARSWLEVKMMRMSGRTLVPDCVVQRQTFCKQMRYQFLLKTWPDNDVLPAQAMDKLRDLYTATRSSPSVARLLHLGERQVALDLGPRYTLREMQSEFHSVIAFGVHNAAQVCLRVLEAVVEFHRHTAQPFVGLSLDTILIDYKDSAHALINYQDKDSANAPTIVLTGLEPAALYAIQKKDVLRDPDVSLPGLHEDPFVRDFVSVLMVGIRLIDRTLPSWRSDIDQRETWQGQMLEFTKQVPAELVTCFRWIQQTAARSTPFECLQHVRRRLRLLIEDEEYAHRQRTMAVLPLCRLWNCVKYGGRSSQEAQCIPVCEQMWMQGNCRGGNTRNSLYEGEVCGQGIHVTTEHSLLSEFVGATETGHVIGVQNWNRRNPPHPAQQWNCEWVNTNPAFSQTAVAWTEDQYERFLQEHTFPSAQTTSSRHPHRNALNQYVLWAFKRRGIRVHHLLNDNECLRALRKLTVEQICGGLERVDPNGQFDLMGVRRALLRMCDIAPRAVRQAATNTLPAPLVLVKHNFGALVQMVLRQQFAVTNSATRREYCGLNIEPVPVHWDRMQFPHVSFKPQLQQTPRAHCYRGRLWQAKNRNCCACDVKVVDGTSVQCSITSNLAHAWCALALSRDRQICLKCLEEGSNEPASWVADDLRDMCSRVPVCIGRICTNIFRQESTAYILQHGIVTPYSTQEVSADAARSTAVRVYHDTYGDVGSLREGFATIRGPDQQQTTVFLRGGQQFGLQKIAAQFETWFQERIDKIVEWTSTWDGIRDKLRTAFGNGFNERRAGELLALYFGIEIKSAKKVTPSGVEFHVRLSPASLGDVITPEQRATGFCELFAETLIDAYTALRQQWVDRGYEMPEMPDGCDVIRNNVGSYESHKDWMMDYWRQNKPCEGYGPMFMMWQPYVDSQGGKGIRFGKKKEDGAVSAQWIRLCTNDCLLGYNEAAEQMFHEVRCCSNDGSPRKNIYLVVVWRWSCADGLTTLDMSSEAFGRMIRCTSSDCFCATDAQFHAAPDRIERSFAEIKCPMMRQPSKDFLRRLPALECTMDELQQIFTRNCCVLSRSGTVERRQAVLASTGLLYGLCLATPGSGGKLTLSDVSVFHRRRRFKAVVRSETFSQISFDMGEGTESDEEQSTEHCEESAPASRAASKTRRTRGVKRTRSQSPLASNNVAKRRRTDEDDKRAKVLQLKAHLKQTKQAAFAEGCFQGVLGSGRSAVVCEVQCAGEAEAVKIFVSESECIVEHKVLSKVVPAFGFCRALGRSTVEVDGRHWTALRMSKCGTSLSGPVSGGEMTRSSALAYVLEIVRSLRHLAKCGWTHGDVKPSNVCRVHEDQEAFASQICLVDFGRSQNVHESESGRTASRGGTRRWSSLRVQSTSQKSFWHSDDLWSATWMLHAMLNGPLRWEQKSDCELRQIKEALIRECVHNKERESVDPVTAELVRILLFCRENEGLSLHDKIEQMIIAEMTVFAAQFPFLHLRGLQVPEQCDWKAESINLLGGLERHVRHGFTLEQPILNSMLEKVQSDPSQLQAEELNFLRTSAADFAKPEAELVLLHSGLKKYEAWDARDDACLQEMGMSRQGVTQTAIPHSGLLRGIMLLVRCTTYDESRHGNVVMWGKRGRKMSVVEDFCSIGALKARWTGKQCVVELSTQAKQKNADVAKVQKWMQSEVVQRRMKVWRRKWVLRQDALKDPKVVTLRFPFCYAIEKGFKMVENRKGNIFHLSLGD